VSTDLNAPLSKNGVDVNVLIDAVYSELRAGKEEIAYGFSEIGMNICRSVIEKPCYLLNKDVCKSSTEHEGRERKRQLQANDLI
jgi:hypothetical protein